MKKTTKWIAGILAAVMLLAAVGCSRDPKDPDWNANQGNSNGENYQSGQNEGPATEPIPERTEPTKEGVSLTFNQAVQLFEALGNYTMTGSVSSTSIIGDVTSTVVTSIDCQYEKKSDGTVHMVMDSDQHFNNTVFAHTTYFTQAPGEDPYYYIDTLGTKYFVRTNDFQDFGASAYLKQVDESKIENLEVIYLTAENQTQFGFEIPYGSYPSEALVGILGDFVDDTLAAQPVRIKIVVNSDGSMASLFMNVQNTVPMGADMIEQEIVASLTFTNCGITTVAVPSGLDTYEDRTFKEEHGGQNPDGETVPYNPGDFD